MLTFAVSCKDDDLLDGVDKNALFAAPTAEEISHVQSMWDQRDLIPDEIKIEESHTINANLQLHIISFRLFGSKEYAAVFVPSGTQPLPIYFNVGGFGLHESVNSLNVQLGSNISHLYVFPALRGQSLSIKVHNNNTTYTSPISEGSRLDAFDGATDDVIASLNAVAALFPNADENKAIIRGGSRGGTVALLAGERDQRFKRVAPVAFNVDFIGMTANNQNDPTYQAQFLTELINGSSSIAETRTKMIASSPLYFYNRLPKTQMHCAANDQITPPSQGQLLYDAMKNGGMQDKAEFYMYPNRDHSNIASGNTEMESRINSFFSGL